MSVFYDISMKKPRRLYKSRGIKQFCRITSGYSGPPSAVVQPFSEMQTDSPGGQTTTKRVFGQCGKFPSCPSSPQSLSQGRQTRAESPSPESDDSPDKARKPSENARTPN